MAEPDLFLYITFHHRLTALPQALVAERQLRSRLYGKGAIVSEQNSFRRYADDCPESAKGSTAIVAYCSMTGAES